jgi:WD40 repeat protein
MDICIRKQLIVTCSNSYIKVWNYANKTLEISFPCQAGEETMAVAFHPSGFHIVCAFTDAVVLMNVLSSTLKEFNRLPYKGCTKVAFSNGGHFFACSVEKKNIHVVNFYTAECPNYLQIKGHGVIN